MTRNEYLNSGLDAAARRWPTVSTHSATGPLTMRAPPSISRAASSPMRRSLSGLTENKPACAGCGMAANTRPSSTGRRTPVRCTNRDFDTVSFIVEHPTFGLLRGSIGWRDGACCGIAGIRRFAQFQLQLAGEIHEAAVLGAPAFFIA